jgi:CheY-like chemotaxis protein
MNEAVGKRILVVDDEECIADTLALILRSSGYEAGSVHDGRSALRECERWMPDLVISDVVMPELNGIDLAIAIRERYPACKILLISGLAASQELAEQAFRKGHSFEILAKPIRPIELLAKIKTVLKDDDVPQDGEERNTIEEHSVNSFAGNRRETGELRTGS